MKLMKYYLIRLKNGSQMKNKIFVGEFIGSCFLVMIIVGSGLMAENLSNDVAVMLIANTIATGAGYLCLLQYLLMYQELTLIHL